MNHTQLLNFLYQIKNKQIMENYKADYYNPETFEKTEIETKISSDLVYEVKQSLDKMEGYLITPTIIDPEELSVVWGIMDNTNKLKYKITITPNN